MSEVNRAAYLAAAKLVVIKIGSAVLADPQNLNMPVIASLAAQIARIMRMHDGRRIIIVSSGAVAAGRAEMAAHYKPVEATDQTSRQALAAIGQGRLAQAWNGAFTPLGIITAQALLTRGDFTSRERFQHAANTFSRMLAWGILPIVNENDTVAVHELQFGDNDCLASLLVNMVEADLFVNLTSAPGVFAANPEKDSNAQVMDSIADIGALDVDALCGAGTRTGSGGMRSKLLAARRVAQLGVPTLILPGRRKDVLPQAFNGENAGTWICPAATSIPRRKFWLAYQSDPQGSVSIDDGAAHSLQNGGGSLLPGGIISVEGNFGKGALLKVLHNGIVLGVGFSSYSAADLARICGRKRHEVAAILGDAKYPDVIHRDNMLLDAAF